MADQKRAECHSAPESYEIASYSAACPAFLEALAPTAVAVAFSSALGTGAAWDPMAPPDVGPDFAFTSALGTGAAWDPMAPPAVAVDCDFRSALGPRFG